MIFLSHNCNDKNLVEEIAKRLEKIYGRENIFYDSWSIQPGEGIIKRMNEGLENCKYFFFFISENSLKSKMVSLEWQNALMKSINGDIKFIPIKLDKSIVPAILTQSLYIDLYTYGIEVAISQMVDVIDGNNTFRYKDVTFENVHGYITIVTDSKFKIEFRAEYYLEPQSKFIILLDNDVESIKIKSTSDSVYSLGSQKGITLNNGEQHNAINVSVSRSTSPGFPFIVTLETKDGKKIELRGLMRAISNSYFKMIPCKFVEPNE